MRVKIVFDISRAKTELKPETMMLVQYNKHISVPMLDL